MVSKFLLISLIISNSIPKYYGHDLKGFDDTILYKINWKDEHDNVLKGTEEPILDETTKNKIIDDREEIIITSSNKEKYRCLIPNIDVKESETIEAYTGEAPLELVSTLFHPASCSYKIESYWTYELCHGQYIKQYHEDRNGKAIKLHEYFLGKWDKLKTEELRKKLDTPEIQNQPLQYKKIDGLNLPYFEIEMIDGTLCDLNNLPRVTKVLYICYAHSKNVIYSLKETSTCNYEVIVLTQSLCTHPSFKQQETTENNIECFPLNEAPKIPHNLLAIEYESMKMRLEKMAQQEPEHIAVFKLDPKDGTMKMELLPANFLETILATSSTSNAEQITQEGKIVEKDKNEIKKPKRSLLSPVDSFFHGINCLTGGNGWWKFEICYGRYVRQFHDSKNGQESIMLGFFNEEAHLDWLKRNEHKRPLPSDKRTHLIHYYQSGAVCEKTGKRRTTEVKLKCLENTSSTTSISLYLMEPQTCQYILGVESPFLCDIIKTADDNGIIPKQIRGIDNDDESTSQSALHGVYVGEGVVEDIEVRFEND